LDGEKIQKGTRKREKKPQREVSQIEARFALPHKQKEKGDPTPGT